MKKTFIAVICALSAVASSAADMTEEQKTVYAIGAIMGKQVSVFNLSPAELELVKKGLTDAVKGGKMAVELETYMPKVQELASKRVVAAGAKQAAAGKVFAAQAAKEAGAVKTASGLVYISLKDGSGPSPTANDIVKVNYRGTLIDGTEFDSSYKRNEPIEFPLSGVIKCWGEGVQKMKVGGKARLVCPPEIAYGEQGTGGAIPPNSTLNFEVELLAVKAPPKAAASEPAVKK
ncbi:MAG: peptidylprolyl cis-trans isomerase, FKBP-type [Rhodocyclales bacterium]|nr:peptidylprolyl cis-trans isomerase, FKBP-type [Rhodocyclales bacterium]